MLVNNNIMSNEDDVVIEDYNLYDTPENFLQNNKSLIPTNHINRINDIKKYEMFYQNNRTNMYNYYKSEFVKTLTWKKSTWNNMFLIPNYLRKGTTSLVNLCASYPPIFDSDKKKISKSINNYVKNNDIFSKIKKIITYVHSTGNCFARIIDGPIKKLQILDTTQVFIFLDSMTQEVNAYLVYTVINNKANILVSRIGQDDYYSADINNNVISDIVSLGSKKLSFNDFSVQNFYVNEELKSSGYGLSEYSEGEIIQANICALYNELKVIYDKFAAPILVYKNGDGSGSELTESYENNDVVCNDGTLQIPMKNEGQKIETGKMVDVGDGDLKYITWESPNEDFMKLINMLKNEFVNSTGMESAIFDENLKTKINSSKALKLMFSNSIDKANQYCNAIQDTLVKVLKILTNTNLDENVSIKWQSGLPTFEDEEIQNVDLRLLDGTMSKIEAIMNLDDCDEDTAQEKLNKIQKENKTMTTEDNSSSDKLNNNNNTNNNKQEDDNNDNTTTNNQ